MSIKRCGRKNRKPAAFSMLSLLVCADGIVYISQDQWSADFPEFYHTSFHDVNYIFNHWAEFLDIRCYIPRGSLDYQDMIVLQKPAF
jgi:hypothetical protein